MNNILKKISAITLFGIVISSTSLPVLAKTEWTIKVFDPGMSAIDINASGQVVGKYFGTNRLFITGPDGEGITVLDIEITGSATAINDSGQVVGINKGGSSFITGANGVGINYLDTLGGVGTYATDINISGQAVGYSFTSTGSMHAFITGANGVGMADLGTLGGDYSIAYGVNDSGQVVGVSETAYGDHHAFITGPGGVGMTDLGTLDGGNYSAAGSINNSGQVVGETGLVISDEGYYEYNGFITGPNGEGMAYLGRGSQYPNFAGLDINDSGQVIGNFQTAINVAWLYSDGIFTNLGSLAVIAAAGFDFEMNATAINDKGQILGRGINPSEERSFLLTPIISPVPEPSTYAMLLAGLGLGFMVRRRRMFL